MKGGGAISGGKGGGSTPPGGVPSSNMDALRESATGDRTKYNTARFARDSRGLPVFTGHGAPVQGSGQGKGAAASGAQPPPGGPSAPQMSQQQLANAGHGAQGASQTLPTQANQQAQQNAFGNNPNAQAQGALTPDEVEQYNKWRMASNRVQDSATRAYDRYNSGLERARENWLNQPNTGNLGDVFQRYYEGVGGGEETSSNEGPGGMPTYADTYKKYRYDFKDPNKNYGDVRIISPARSTRYGSQARQEYTLDEFNELAGRGKTNYGQYKVEYSGGRNPDDFDSSEYDANWNPGNAPSAFDEAYYRDQAGIGDDVNAWTHYIQQGREKGYGFRPEYSGRMPSSGPVQVQYPTQSYQRQPSFLDQRFQPRFGQPMSYGNPFGQSMGYGNPFAQRYNPAMNMRFSQPTYRPQPQYQPRYMPRPRPAPSANYISRLLRGF